MMDWGEEAPQFDAAELWRAIRDAGIDRPLSAEARAYLFETAQRVAFLLEDHPETPEKVAQLMPGALGLSGAAIRTDRDRRHAEKFGALFALKTAGAKRGEVKAIAADLAEKAGIKPRRLYDWLDRVPPNIRELVRTLQSGRRAK